MNKWLKLAGLVFIMVAVTVLALGGAAAWARSADGPWGARGAPFGDRAEFGGPGFGPFEGKGPGGPGRGAGGKVTAVGDNSLTLENRAGETVTVNVTGETRIMIAETRSEGSMSDIDVGDNVRVMGRPNDDGVVEARGILVLPDGDIAGGRVTAVDGNNITVENPEDGSVTIVTNADTQFRLGPDETGSLADVTVDKMVMAFGDLQEDGSLVARLVFIHERGPGPGPHGPGKGHAAGEVTSIDGATFKLDPILRDIELTVLTDDSTEYRTRTGDEVSFEDIQVGSMVVVKGRPVEGQENTIQAEVVGIKLDQ